MGYIYDDLITHGMPYKVTGVPSGREPDKVLSEATVVHVDQVFDYYNRETPDEEYIDIGDFPNLVPRFRALFIERRLPNCLVFGGEPLPSSQDQRWRQGRWYAGMLFEGVNLRKDPVVSRSGRRNLREVLSEQCGEAAHSEDVRWCLNVYLVCASPYGGPIEGPLVNWLLPIKQDGSIQANITGEGPTLISIPLVPEVEELAMQRAYVNSALAYLLPALFAFSTINSPVSRLISAEESRNNIFDLELGQLKDDLDTKGNAGQFGLRRALTACRSSFFSE